MGVSDNGMISGDVAYDPNIGQFHSSESMFKKFFFVLDTPMHPLVKKITKNQIFWIPDQLSWFLVIVER